MITWHRQSVSMMITCCISLHLWWAIMLIIDAPAATASTALHELYHFIPDVSMLVIVLILVAISAFAAEIINVRPWSTWLVLPQQLLLMVSASGCLNAIYIGQYADGVLRPRVFIATDQSIVVLIALWHTAALLGKIKQRQDG